MSQEVRTYTCTIGTCIPPNLVLMGGWIEGEGVNFPPTSEEDIPTDSYVEYLFHQFLPLVLKRYNGNIYVSTKGCIYVLGMTMVLPPLPTSTALLTLRESSD